MSYLCSDCPRECGAVRNEYTGEGFCGAGEKIAVAKIMRHMWEEPVLSTGNGTENIFIYGCNLGCVYCQNYKINGSLRTSELPPLTYLTPAEFGELLVERSETGADTVGIVTGDHYIRQIAEAITPDVKKRIKTPLVLNMSGYSKPETLALLNGKIDIFMPDFKYVSEKPAQEYSQAPDYPARAVETIKKCFEMTGPATFDEKTYLMKSGVIIRHLILPGWFRNTAGVIDFVNENFRPDEVVFSLMSQYTPMNSIPEISSNPRLSRRISAVEHKAAIDYLWACENITMCFCQDRASSSEEFIPDFDGSETFQ
ncbi:MAG: radical SAM protein [Clostridia bacterium]|nr:radical SAM protein [Clostridia bacterium]MBO7502793.1 radical SAM protein [Clostridia bacterium]MBO7659737.1 radical SAM protein [Clostridia bacterium]MBP5664720.1 radical SAM protein [Clostridia bacterium]MBP5767167.1 radical SAM protein [Clostridia bacterium]